MALWPPIPADAMRHLILRVAEAGAYGAVASDPGCRYTSVGFWVSGDKVKGGLGRGNTYFLKKNFSDAIEFSYHDTFVLSASGVS